jgi:hypothetical protein
MISKAQLKPCKQCRITVWQGFDGEVCALLAYADVMPLSAIGEVLALLDGRRTYRLMRRGERSALQVRDRWDIRTHPAGQSSARCTYDVLAQHRCGAAILPGLVSVYAQTIKEDRGTDDLPPY